jgi:hypothetical protein
VRTACPSKRFFGSSAPLIFFECGQLVPRSALSGLWHRSYSLSVSSLTLEVFFWVFRTAHILRVWIACPSKRSFGSLAPPIFFECGHLVPRSTLLDLQHRSYSSSAGILSLKVLFWVFDTAHILRLRAACPSKRSFGSSALLIFFECGHLVPRSALSGLPNRSYSLSAGTLSLEALFQVFITVHILRVWAACPLKRFFGCSAPLIFFECGLSSLEALHLVFNTVRII